MVTFISCGNACKWSDIQEVTIRGGVTEMFLIWKWFESYGRAFVAGQNLGLNLKQHSLPISPHSLKIIFLPLEQLEKLKGWTWTCIEWSFLLFCDHLVFSNASHVFIFQSYSFLISSDYERAEWKEIIKEQQKKCKCQSGCTGSVIWRTR